MSGQHIGTAHILKAKGANVSDDFGAEAVCTAAGKGDVPKLRMLHSFGQSLDVGDYDDRCSLQRERERQTDRQRETDRQTHTDRQTDTRTRAHTHTKRERERARAYDKHANMQTHIF